MLICPSSCGLPRRSRTLRLVVAAVFVASPAIAEPSLTPTHVVPSPSEFPAKPESVSDPTDIKRAIAGFGSHLAAFSQRVSKCDHVVRIQIGKDSPTYGRGLAAYGAYCDLASGQGVALCYEEAIGRFALVADAFPVDRAWIEAFTLRTCASLD